MNMFLPFPHLRSAQRFGLSCALAFSLILSQHARAQVPTGTLTCGGTDTLSIGKVLQNDSVEYAIRLINRFGSNTTSWHVGGGAATFFLSDTVGSAPQDSTWNTYVEFNAIDTALGLKAASCRITSDVAPTCTANLVLLAQVIGPTPDGTTFDLQDTAPPPIAFESSVDSASRLFYFKNTSGGPLVINSISIKQSSAFSIASRPALPDTIAPQDSFGLGLLFYRSAQGSDNGLLAIGRPDEPILFDVALQGVRTANAAVHERSDSTAFVSIYPNPALGSVVLHVNSELSAEAITVMDVLGRIITQSKVAGDWLWSRETASGGYAPAGTYFVIVTGRNASGKAVRELERIVLE